MPQVSPNPRKPERPANDYLTFCRCFYLHARRTSSSLTLALLRPRSKVSRQVAGPTPWPNQRSAFLPNGCTRRRDRHQASRPRGPSGRCFSSRCSRRSRGCCHPYRMIKEDLEQTKIQQSDLNHRFLPGIAYPFNPIKRLRSELDPGK